MALTFRLRRVAVESNRAKCQFEDGTVFRRAKRDIVDEIEEAMKMVGLSRLQLARRLNVQPSAVTQSLALTRGLQLTTLVRFADIMGFDVEMNLIRRHEMRVAQAVAIELDA